jgi:hypothetical protein
MAEFKGSETALVADVDCTKDEAKDLCEEHGVEGYPSLKHGDPSSLEDYEGGRSYKDLLKFAKENLGPKCGPTNLDLCDDEKRAIIGKYEAMSDSDLAKEIEDKETEMKGAEKELETLLESLQKQYEDGTKAKDEKIKAIKAAGLGFAKAVKANRGKKGSIGEL